jgi:hypothetical protein
MQRVITRMPLAELWDDAGPVVARRGGDLTAADISELLRAGRVRFVVADIGVPPRWVPESECFAFWKAEVQPRVADPAAANLSEFPGGYCYFAAKWVPPSGSPIVALQRSH